MNYTAAAITLAVFFTMFVIPELAKYFNKRVSPSGKRISHYATLTIIACCVSGFIGTFTPDPYKVAICLFSFGMICLMTLFILSLLFIATIPEDMEREAEDDKD